MSLIKLSMALFALAAVLSILKIGWGKWRTGRVGRMTESDFDRKKKAALEGGIIAGKAPKAGAFLEEARRHRAAQEAERSWRAALRAEGKGLPEVANAIARKNAQDRRNERDNAVKAQAAKKSIT